MSPKRCQPRSSVAAAVAAGSLWYSNTGPSEKATAPVAPAGSSAPSSPTMWTSPIIARPTLPGCASHSSLVIQVSPQPSVEA